MIHAYFFPLKGTRKEFRPQEGGIKLEEILTPSQVAELLRIHVKTVYRLANEGTIPGNRIGRSWRFRKRDILNLVSHRQEIESKEEN